MAGKQRKWLHAGGGETEGEYHIDGVGPVEQIMMNDLDEEEQNRLNKKTIQKLKSKSHAPKPMKQHNR